MSFKREMTFSWINLESWSEHFKIISEKVSSSAAYLE
jgi:hypothetical protein